MAWRIARSEAWGPGKPGSTARSASAVMGITGGEMTGGRREAPRAAFGRSNYGSPFHGSALDAILRNLGVRTVVATSTWRFAA